MATRYQIISTKDLPLASITALSAHLTDTANPHSVTAADVAAVPNDGWIATSWASLTRTGDHVFTSTTDVTGVIQKGTKLKLTDTTTKYFVVKSATYSAGTSTITVLTTTSYALVGNPSAIYYSPVENPFGWPGKFNFTPTVTASSGSITAYAVNICSYIVSGRKMDMFAQITITTNGTANGTGQVTIPADVVTMAGGAGRENALTGKSLQVQSGGTVINLFVYDNSTPFAGDGAVWQFHATWDW